MRIGYYISKGSCDWWLVMLVSIELLVYVPIPTHEATSALLLRFSLSVANAHEAAVRNRTAVWLPGPAAASLRVRVNSGSQFERTVMSLKHHAPYGSAKSIVRAHQSSI